MKQVYASLIIFLLGISPVMANEYSTQETVRYVVNCMQELGGQSDENLYTCACRYDAIRSHMSFSDYEEGITFERNKAMPGEKGSSFRDNKRGEGFYEKLLEVREVADKSCIVVKQVKRPPPSS